MDKSNINRCTVCKKIIQGPATIFNCPKCGERIVRCEQCKKTGQPWICPNCGFKGP